MDAVKFVLIIHKVNDYEIWKKIFDNASVIRKEAGEISYQLLKYYDNPNNIVHLSICSSHQDAKQFFDSPELIKIRKEAGVKEPEFIYLDLIEDAFL